METFATWGISLGSIVLVLIRPKGWPEAVWAVAGACLLVVCGLISPTGAMKGVAAGTDVYLFLVGMMVISELARRQGVFDWVAVHAVRAARGSRQRLFALVYGVGIVVTVLLSNDATAVVLTPAVLAAVQAAEADPLPYLLVCAFIANAASFVLPISNPANLVVFGNDMPPLVKWLAMFGLASAVSIVATFLILRTMAAPYLQGPVKAEIAEKPLSAGGRMTLGGIGFLALGQLSASAMNWDLGVVAFGVGWVVAFSVALRDRTTWKDMATGISWSVLPMVAGLFVIVEALNGVGALRDASEVLNHLQRSRRPEEAAIVSAFGIAAISNLVNNLPSGLISAAALKTAHIGGTLRAAVLVGVDLGPNLSVTGSLATILWLVAIRREGLNVTFWDFLKWGVWVMPPVLLLAIVALFVGDTLPMR